MNEGVLEAAELLFAEDAELILKLGAHAGGRRGLDKVHGGWINNLRREHTEVRYDANLWFKSWVPVFLIRLAERGYAPWFVDCLERQAAELATAAAPPQNAAANDAAPRL